MRVGILTGGGDCPGLNAVIYGALLKASQYDDVEVIGIKKGWQFFDYDNEEITDELKEKYLVDLDIGELDDLHTEGGTILYTSRTNPFKAVGKVKDEDEKDALAKKIGKEMASKFEILGIDALIAVGGDDTCGVAATMYDNAKAKVCACPKTIDNDLAGTDYTFGFFSGAQLASNALDNINTTAQSHQRIFIVEVMGRDAGWLTLYSGLSAGSDIVLLPEIPFSFKEDVVDVLKARANAGYKYHIIACSEGAYPTKESLENDFTVVSKEDLDNLPKDDFGNELLTHLNMSEKITLELKKNKELKEYFEKCDANYEVRSVVLGHTMRSGTPNVFDRVLGLRYGFHAMQYIIDGNYGKMTSLQGTKIVPVDLIEGAQKSYVDPEGDLIQLRDAMVSVKHQSKEKYH